MHRFNLKNLVAMTPDHFKIRSKIKHTFQKKNIREKKVLHSKIFIKLI